MMEDERVSAVKHLLSEYVRSPSLKHIRDPYSLAKLAGEIVKRIDQRSSIWGKWDGQREVLIKSAVGCWVPIDDLRDFLNEMPGPRLTSTDIGQRLKAAELESYESSKEELQAGCLAIYETERAAGTELPAIIQRLREHVDLEEDRLRVEQQERYRKFQEDEQTERERRLLSGADCGWTQLGKLECWHCRANGRTYRLSQTEDKMWELHQVRTLTEDEEGAYIGRYKGRRVASKAIEQVAYQFEPRW